MASTPHTNIDTSRSGKYRMIYSSVSAELDTTLTVRLNYKSYSYYNTMIDTTEKYILYTIPNNYDQSQGKVRISKTAIYVNESTNKSQPYVKEYRSVIYDGFLSSSKVKLNNSNRFSGDTMILNYHVSPTSGSQYDICCKYLKQ